jgi:hypothetical protein
VRPGRCRGVGVATQSGCRCDDDEAGLTVRSG